MHGCSNLFFHSCIIDGNCLQMSLCTLCTLDQGNSYLSLLFIQLLFQELLWTEICWISWTDLYCCMYFAVADLGSFKVSTEIPFVNTYVLHLINEWTGGRHFTVQRWWFRVLLSADVASETLKVPLSGKVHKIVADHFWRGFPFWKLKAKKGSQQFIVLQIFVPLHGILVSQ